MKKPILAYFMLMCSILACTLQPSVSKVEHVERRRPPQYTSAHTAQRLPQHFVNRVIRYTEDATK